MKKLTVWMPIAVSFYASLNATMEYMQLSPQLRQTNGALTALKNQKLWWESLTMVQRRMEENKQQLVIASEAAGRPAITSAAVAPSWVALWASIGAPATSPMA